MKKSKSILHPVIALLVSVSLTSCSENSKDSSKTETPGPTIRKAEMENEAWQMEELYWEYVQKIDTVAYKTLWHDDFIGYPSFGYDVSNNSKLSGQHARFHMTIKKQIINT